MTGELKSRLPLSPAPSSWAAGAETGSHSGPSLPLIVGDSPGQGVICPEPASGSGYCWGPRGRIWGPVPPDVHCGSAELPGPPLLNAGSLTVSGGCEELDPSGSHSGEKVLGPDWSHFLGSLASPWDDTRVTLLSMSLFNGL